MYLLDSNVVISALLQPKRFGKETKSILLSSSENYVSAISVFEIATKQMLGKLKLSASIQEILGKLNAKQLGFQVADAFEVFSLTTLVRHDPFDRMILSTALANKASLITSDRKLLDLEFDWIIDSSL
jgi:putative PIN family toxin of toxin-antitoxin system